MDTALFCFDILFLDEFDASASNERKQPLMSPLSLGPQDNCSSSGTGAGISSSPTGSTNGVALSSFNVAEASPQVALLFLSIASVRIGKW